MDRSAYNSLENGRAGLGEKRAIRLAQYYGIGLDQFDRYLRRRHPEPLEDRLVALDQRIGELEIHEHERLQLREQFLDLQRLAGEQRQETLGELRELAASVAELLEHVAALEDRLGVPPSEHKAQSHGE